MLGMLAFVYILTEANSPAKLQKNSHIHKKKRTEMRFFLQKTAALTEHRLIYSRNR